MKIISVDGIVISSTPFKESSKIINIFTKDMGIIGCIAKGSKSLKSKLRLPSEKFAYGTFHMYYKEKGLSTLIDGDIKDYLPDNVNYLMDGYTTTAEMDYRLSALFR